MNTPDLLTREQRKLVETELEPGEQLLWAAPARPRIFTIHSVAILLFAAIWCGFFLYFTGAFFLGDSSGQDTAPEQTGILLIGLILTLLPFIAVGCGTFWYFRHERRVHEGICTVTDRRALLIRSSRGTVIRTEWSGERLHECDIRPRRRNRGDIILGIKEMRSKNGTRIIAYGFHGIDNPEQIAALLKQAAPIATPPPATEPPLPAWPRTADRATRQHMETLLAPGENIRWITPRNPNLFTPATGFIFIFGFFWTSVILILLATPADRIEGDMPLFVVAIFFCLGLVALSSPWLHWAYARRQYYILTDRRIIRYNPGLRAPSIQTRSYATLESTRLSIRQNGTGSLILAHTSATPGRAIDSFTLGNIPDIRRTYILARQMAAATTQPLPPGSAHS